VAKWENLLQRSGYLIRKYNIKIWANTSVTKIMAFRGRDPVRNKIMEQMNTCDYVGSV
jgi:hypothetical protein